MGCRARVIFNLGLAKAASVADECDIVTVHGGEYRECVTVVRGARSENNRIAFFQDFCALCSEIISFS
jgi:hypothetical protein